LAAETRPLKPTKRVPAIFFQTRGGNEPVREWLRDNLSKDERRQVASDVRTVEYGWPIGMLTCRPLGEGLYEVRTDLPGRIARILFYVDERQRMILLHGFIKKSRTLPASDEKLARSRKAEHEKGIKNERD